LIFAGELQVVAINVGAGTAKTFCAVDKIKEAFAEMFIVFQYGYTYLVHAENLQQK
jgi:hypothetical protein